MSKDPDTALRLHTREELGVDPAELPSPVVAGVASLFAFSLGALVPLLPYLFGWPVLAASLGIAAVALITGGMTVGRLTGAVPGWPWYPVSVGSYGPCCLKSGFGTR